MVAYDYAITNTLVKQLLINIARAHHHQTDHFTGVSNIAATFDFRAFAGGTPPLGGVDGGFILSPLFGAMSKKRYGIKDKDTTRCQLLITFG